MEKQNLREYSDNELSLVVFNDEYLYAIRHRRIFMQTIEKYFLYTEEQLEVLKQDLESDLIEEGG